MFPNGMDYTSHVLSDIQSKAITLVIVLYKYRQFLRGILLIRLYIITNTALQISIQVTAPMCLEETFKI